MNNTIIYCAEGLGEKTYDYLHSVHMQPVCFCDSAVDKQGMLILDLPIYDYEKCKLLYSSLYPECKWYIANSNYGKMCTIKKQLVEDGVKESEIIWSLNVEEIVNRQNVYFDTILKNKQLVLVGRKSLCEDLKETFKKKEVTDYIKILEYYSNLDEKTVRDYAVNHLESIYFIVTRDLYVGYEQKRREIYNCLKSAGVKSITQRYSKEFYYLKRESIAKGECQNIETRSMKQPKRIEIEDVNTVLFHIGEAYSGTFYFRDLFTKQENVLYLDDTPFHAMLWLIIKEVKSKKITAIPYKIVEWCEEYFTENKELFIQEFQKATKNRKSLSEKEIFTAVYIAFFYMKGNEYIGSSEPIIYFEPHSNHDLDYFYLCWFKNNFTTVKQLRIVRNLINKGGSCIRYCLSVDHKLNCETIRQIQYYGCYGSKKDEILKDSDKITIRFEDLKIYPKEMLGYICKKIHISLDEKIFNFTDQENKKIARTWGLKSMFDLKPVYYNYDEYFSSFDRFRLDILYRERQKVYGYSFIDINKLPFTQEQIEELYKTPYKFEKLIEFKSETQRVNFRKQLYDDAKYVLNLLKNMERNKENSKFDNCYIYSEE